MRTKFRQAKCCPISVLEIILSLPGAPTKRENLKNRDKFIFYGTSHGLPAFLFLCSRGRMPSDVVSDTRGCVQEKRRHHFSALTFDGRPEALPQHGEKLLLFTQFLGWLYCQTRVRRAYNR